ncbi:MAG TPA: HDOD domain-containing protein [Methylophaga aminisulfidivorans]|uniref:HDOD domain-containing protein n=1 Tax=Methylophaga aminisulfidivorans TaxID=230105 RepID=A0A7C2AG06_9GAMM|nr:HDOD domain-containing protein [Methylophaga aminisulfidivorans]
MDKYDSLNALIEKLSEQDMPVFSSTVMNVSNAVNSGKTSASDVANIILQDASLTSRVLKTVKPFILIRQKMLSVQFHVLSWLWDLIKSAHWHSQWH